METDYSKRVYQGVRVKHTVKDLLAEKRSRLTNVPRFNAGTNSSQAAFVQMPGSHVLPGYYPMRRPFLQDSELCHPMKQYSTDTYSSSLGGKPFSYDHPSSYSFIDSYYPSDTFGDYRTTSTYSSSGGSLFPSTSSLPPLLPPLSTESSSSHLLLRDTWDQSTEDPVSQPETLCPGGTTPGNGSPSLGVQDSENASTYRMPTARTSGSMSSGSQPYPVQSLEEVHYPATSYTPVSNFCPPYMTVPGDLAVAKMPTMSTEENSDGTVAHSDTSTWAKDDGNGSWLSYESRRAF